MNTSDHIELISKFLSGNMTEEEQTDFLGWVASSEENQTLLAEAEKVWQLSNHFAEPAFETNIEAAWNKVDAAIAAREILDKKGPESEAIIKKLPAFQQLLKIAAVFIIVSVAVWWWWSGTGQPTANTMALVKTELQEVQKLILPDGTEIWLNGGSELAYDENFEERIVELRGEAFFDVAHDEQRPFEILTGAAKTVVLGTAFNLRAYPQEEEVELTVVRGKVALAKEDDPTKVILLEAGAAGVYRKDFKEVRKIEKTSPNADAWKTRELKFNNTPLDEVLENLERYFNIELNVENKALLKCHFTGRYQKPQLDQILQVLEYGVNVKVEQENGQYLLKGSGCE